MLFNHQQGVVEADDVNEGNNKEQQLLPLLLSVKFNRKEAGSTS